MMRILIFILSLLTLAPVYGEPEEIPVSTLPPGEIPPIKRTVSIRPTVFIDGNMLEIEYPSSSEILVEIRRGQEIVFSETTLPGTLMIPDLETGIPYSIILTVNNQCWIGCFETHNFTDFQN